MKNIYQTFQFGRNQCEFEFPCKYGMGNSNNSLLRIYFTYGVANGYSKQFEFNLLHPEAWGCFTDSFNGHKRHFFGCGLFSFFFDTFDKSSIINLNEDLPLTGVATKDKNL